MNKTRKSLTPKELYIAQRAWKTYILSFCQPEASFDLSSAAQIVNPNRADINLLNKRINRQIKNASRGIKFVKLDIKSLKLIIFADSSFANNKDFSSQIGSVIVLADKENWADILYSSSKNCKRITRSVLAAEVYAMVNGFDSGATIKSTLKKIFGMQVPLIICTGSKSLHGCLVKLGATREKWLMIDLICLRQSYERREITHVCWIKGERNPADGMIKPNA